MRAIEVQLFGLFRDLEPQARMRLEVDGERVGDLRVAVVAHARAHWPAAACALVARTAFASESSVLRDGDPLPDTGAMALLPPVSGG